MQETFPQTRRESTIVENNVRLSFEGIEKNFGQKVPQPSPINLEGMSYGLFVYQSQRYPTINRVIRLAGFQLGTYFP